MGLACGKIGQTVGDSLPCYVDLGGNLPPVAFDKYVTVAPMLVAGSYPDRMRAWRFFPAARLPRICVPVPAVIPGNPYMARARTDGSVFPDGNRRSQLNHNLCMGWTYTKSEPEQCG